MQQPKLVVFLFEGNIHTYRQIFMDGRGHPDDPDPTWYGHSIGKWEGDTLVVDTIGFNDKFWFDFAGHPHTPKLHITERYRRHRLFQPRLRGCDRRSGSLYQAVYDVRALAADRELGNHGVHLQRE